MQYFQSLEQIKAARIGKVCVTIGNFDGIHVGHQQVLLELQKLAQHYHDCHTLLIAFEPQPLEFFNIPVGRIFTGDQKKYLLQQADLVDNLLILPFTQALADSVPEEFLAQLCEALEIQAFLIGDDFRFGKDRQGNYDTFKELAPKYHFDIANLSTILFQTQRVSSTAIRKLLAADNFETANQLLLEPFHFNGIVQTGRKLARTLNSPTANIEINRKHSPIHGTYFCTVKIMDKQFQYQEFVGICNVGYKPTVNSDMNKWLCEVHILNFNHDIYGKEIRVYPVAKHRAEVKFNSFDELKQQITKDIALAYKYFHLTPTLPQ